MVRSTAVDAGVRRARHQPVAALAVVLSLVRGTLTRRRLYAFTALAVGDFVVAIGLTIWDERRAELSAVA